MLATTGGAAKLDLDTASADGILDLPTAWLFGSEAHGLPDEVIAVADEVDRVPIYGAAESLNLATRSGDLPVRQCPRTDVTGESPSPVFRNQQNHRCRLT